MGIPAIIALIIQLLPEIQKGVGDVIPVVKNLVSAIENIFNGKDPTPEQIAAVQQARKLVLAAIDEKS